MSRLLGQGWSSIAFSVVCWATTFGVSPAIAGHDHKKTTKYELVQGYILQPSANGPSAPAANPAAAPSPLGASPQAANLSTPAPAPALASQPQVQLQLQTAPAPTMTFQMVQAPVQTIQLQLQPAPTQTLQLAAAPMQTVQLFQLQTVQMPTLSIAPQVQASAPSNMVATPVQLLIPQRKCHFFGH